MLDQQIVSIYNKAIEAVKPSYLIKKNLVKSGDNIIINGKVIPTKDRRVKIIAIGKAASAMSVSIEEILGDIIFSGICITKYLHQISLLGMETIEASHPIPDENSIIAAEKIIDFAKGCDKNDLVLVLLSGGASSLVLDLVDGVSLSDMQELYHDIVNSGANINEINCIRKQLSALKGGGLLDLLYPAEVITLAISDVIGDIPSTIGSGLTVLNTNTKEDAIIILKKYRLWDYIPESIRLYLTNKSDKIQNKDEDQQESFHIIGNNQMALQAAYNEAVNLGFATEIVCNNFNKDINELVENVIYKLLSCKDISPTCYLWGGEATMLVSGEGKGGRNQHLVLKVLKALCDLDIKKSFVVASIGTDGTDGPTDADGAIISNKTIELVKASKTDLTPYIFNFDAYHFFESINGLIKTGPTQTNVMDLVIVLIR